ncbi:MAG: DNA adenine methylase [Prevotellaceae bacterium]|nr:DNA adenine methylase [Candidatus Faecinaster equi]
MVTYSPLRYPGGKANLACYLKNLIENNIEDCSYFELYSGGAGAALELLFSGTVRKVVLNDADYHIYAFWHSLLYQTNNLIHLIETEPVTIENWHKQRTVYENFNDYPMLDVGFATFFLNRCNRSGILTKAGPIGGFSQGGKYKIDCRFNKSDLIARIEKIAAYADKIQIYNLDTLDFINQHHDLLSDESSFMYLDPPYFKKGKSLYLNYYGVKDHERLRDTLSGIRQFKWMVSYDDVEEIHQLYNGFNTCHHTLNYSLQTKRKTTEFFIFSDNIQQIK